MAGADEAGAYDEREQKELEAGCDMVLVCNNRLATWTMLKSLRDYRQAGLTERLLEMRGQGGEGLVELSWDPAWQEGVALLEMIQ